MQQVLCDGGEVEMNDRGVYWRRNLSREGFPVCYAVDSRGKTIRSYKVTHPSFANNAITMLWDTLDRADPTPESKRTQLKLLLPTTEHRTYLEAFDVYNMPPLPGRRRA